METEQAREYVKNYVKETKDNGFSLTLVDINIMIPHLRDNGFFILKDGTNEVVGDVMMDGKGNLNFSIIGKVHNE